MTTLALLGLALRRYVPKFDASAPSRVTNTSTISPATAWSASNVKPPVGIVPALTRCSSSRRTMSYVNVLWFSDAACFANR